LRKTVPWLHSQRSTGQLFVLFDCFFGQSEKSSVFSSKPNLVGF